jgi:flagellar hook-associated protein 1 FlgK
MAGGVGGLFSIARTAIAAQQAAIQVIGQNVANAETDGYSRQRVELTPGIPVQFPFGSIGTGVQISDVTRARDSMLDATFRRDSAASEGAGVLRDGLSEIESIFGEPSDLGLSASLDAFWSAWSDLGNSPGNLTAQNVVRQRGVQVTQLLNNYADRLTQLETSTRDRLISSVSDVNRLTSQIATLNAQITAAESNGNQAPDLRDARDKLADQLSTLGASRTVMQANGTMSVLIGGMTIVDAANARQLDVRTGPTTSVGIVGDPDPLTQVDGIMGGALSLLNDTIAGVRTQLDGVAKALVNGVNFLHESGWTAAGDALGGANWVPTSGPTGSRVDFFDPAYTTASKITLSFAVKQNAGVVASGTSQNAPGDNTLALAMASLRAPNGMAALQAAMGASFGTQIGLSTGTTVGGAYRSLIADVGLKTSAATNTATVYETVASQAETRRQSISGVSVDEELTRMLQHQQAYQAAARLVKAAEEMSQVIIDMV